MKERAPETTFTLPDTSVSVTVTARLRFIAAIRARFRLPANCRACFS